jgi:S-methylmethionine-dependent homocysteine/selenocysteine methylase
MTRERGQPSQGPTATRGEASAGRALAERLRAGPTLLLDGALGTELERRGAPATLPLWSTHALQGDPDLVARIHADYAAVGAEILTANTFRTQRRVLARAGLGSRARELTQLAVALARRAASAAGQRVFVAGSQPTLEDCYRPDLVPDAAALAHEHAEHAANLVDAGADAILIETMNTSREAAAATRAARAYDIPVLVSFVCWERDRLLGGEPLAGALAAAAAEGADALLVNCLPASNVAACLPALRAAGLPFGVYANLGAPGVSEGPGGTEDLAPEAFADEALRWLAAGARIVGGCCGTTPEHIRAIARRMAR